MSIEKPGCVETKVKYPEIHHETEITVPEGALVLMIGPPASGKSTFAEKHFPIESVVSTDGLRAEITNNPGNEAMSAPAFATAKSLVEARLRSGRVAVVDAMNLNINSRRAFLDLAKQLKVRVIGVHLDYKQETLLDRDAKRDKRVGSEAITFKAQNKLDVDLLYHDGKINDIFVVNEETPEVSVSLPEIEKQAMAEDKDFYYAANRAEKDVFAYLKKHKERLKEEDFPRVKVEPGSINFISDSAGARQFLENNTTGPQVLDLDFLARRLATSIDDPLVADTAERLLKYRQKLNLVSFVLASEGAGIALQALETKMKAREARIEPVAMDQRELKNAVLEIKRDELTDEPLLILGDVHGCLVAMREMGKLIRREREDNPAAPRRKMVLIGDVPDRGAYSAQTVMYAADKVSRGEAIWILGNHDANLRSGLNLIVKNFEASGKEWRDWVREDFSDEMIADTVRSRNTRKTIREMLKFVNVIDKGTLKKKEERPRLQEHVLRKIVRVLNDAPVYKEWRHLIAVHASMLRVPKVGEVLSDEERKKFTHGIKSYIGGVADTLKIRNVAAKDPDRILVGGHTHDRGRTIDVRSGSVGLDDTGPDLHGMFYPEMNYVSFTEPYILHLTKLTENPELPQGAELWELINFLESQLMVKINHGQKGGELEGLAVVSYDEMAEVRKLWDYYPVLRNFRGLILDKTGRIVARPFKKTHKAGVEIPLEKINIIPEKVFEKANGSLGVCYFFNGRWRLATKFSLFNEQYTVPAQKMLDNMNTKALDPANTYLFEIIFPTDPHIVDYKGKKELVLLNANHTADGVALRWEKVAETAKALGARTAEDLTDKFNGMTIAEIYQYAQTEGNLSNLEGLMAIYIDAVTGEQVTVKVKAVEYDNKKYVRDHLRWDKMFEKFDWQTLTLPPDETETFLGYKRDSLFVQEALQARLNWIKEKYAELEQDFFHRNDKWLEQAKAIFRAAVGDGKNPKEASALAIKAIVPELVEATDAERGAVLGFIRDRLNGREPKLIKFFQDIIVARVEKEQKKRGHAAYWLVPDSPDASRGGPEEEAR